MLDDHYQIGLVYHYSHTFYGYVVDSNGEKRLDPIISPADGELFLVSFDITFTTQTQRTFPIRRGGHNFRTLALCTVEEALVHSNPGVRQAGLYIQRGLI